MIDRQGHLPPPLREPVPGKSRRQRYRTDEILFHEGDRSDGLYLLLSGRLKVYATSGDGDEVVYNVLEPGELLGEIALFGGTRSAAVRAITHAECLVVKNSVAHELMRTRPEFAAHVIAKLVSRARHSTRMARSMALDDVPERVVALLETSAIHDGPALRVPDELTQKEIAQRIGASREMVHKVIRKLVLREFIHKDKKHRMTILRPLSEARHAD